MSMMDQVETHLRSMELRFHRVSPERIMLGFSGRNTSYRVMLVDNGLLLSAVVTGLGIVPERQHEPALRLANRINATRLRWGAFWIDPEDRELVFELALPTLDGISQPQVDLVLAGAVAADAHFPAFAKLFWAGASPEAALTELDEERDSAPPPDLDGGPLPEMNI